MMRILIACEFSGIVRDAFIAAGHDAVSCDLLPTERPGPHIQDDVLNHLDEGWDMMIAFPPCTFLTVSANRVYLNNPERWMRRFEALVFVKKLLDASIDKIALENPVGAISTHIRKPDQIIQPFHHGHKDSKRTCLWLKNLPWLYRTDLVEPEYVLSGTDGKRYSKTAWSTPSTNNPENAKLRSKTYPGIALAMATQWGKLEPIQKVA